MKLFPFTSNLSRHNTRFINRAFAFAALAFCLSATAPIEAATPTAWLCRSRPAIVLQWPRLPSRDKDKDRKSFFIARIKALQYLLRRQGFYKSKLDGQFGPQTTCAVKAFQRSRGLIVDGVVGPQTWQRLVVTLRRGSRGNAVKAVQSAFSYFYSEGGPVEFEPFYEKDSNLDGDGVFDAQTERAVRKFQEGEGLRVDGVVGPETWCALVGGTVKSAKQ